jgi:hypothetical protein
VGQAHLDPRGTEVGIALGRPSQPAVAEAQFAAVSGELPAVKGGDVSVERDIRDSPERHQVRPLPGPR